MLETDALRIVLYGKAVAAVNSLGLACKIGNEPFSPPSNTMYAEFWFRTGNTVQMELGSRGSYECTAGVLQFTIYGPENVGDGAISRMGDGLKRMFNRQQWQVPPDGYVSLNAVNSQLINTKINGHSVVIVDTIFGFYHHDPNPNTLLSD